MLIWCLSSRLSESAEKSAGERAVLVESTAGEMGKGAASAMRAEPSDIVCLLLRSLFYYQVFVIVFVVMIT